jgi:hypothetical protein
MMRHPRGGFRFSRHPPTGDNSYSHTSKIVAMARPIQNYLTVWLSDDTNYTVTFPCETRRGEPSNIP